MLPFFQKFLKRLLIIVIISVILSSIVGTYVMASCYSEGERSGNIIKFSHKGYIFKTWEGELVQRNFSTQADTWYFSVNNPAVAQQINTAVAQGNRVSLHYCEKVYTFFWQGETKYFIDKVTVIPQQQ